MRTTLPLALLSVLFTSTLTAQLDWQHTSGPEGGATWSITSNDQYAFYPDNYFLYRTQDGLVWEQLDIPAIWNLAGYNQSVIAEQIFDDANGGYHTKFIVSHDNGETWTEAVYPPGVSIISSMSICSHGIYIPVGQDNVLYRSVDDGQTWETITPPMEYGYDVKAIENKLYLYSPHAMWRTDADGNNWTDITPPLPQGAYIRELAAKENHIVLTGTDFIWHSHDNGMSWDSISTPWPDEYSEIAFAGDKLFASGGPSYFSVSHDYGQTWEHLPVIQQYLQGMTSINDQLLVTTWDEGVLMWNDEQEEFEHSVNGLYSASIYDLAYGDQLLWAASGSGVFNYDPVTGTWTDEDLPAPEYDYTDIEADENGNVCVVDDFGKLYVTQDNGENWETKEFDNTFLFSVILHLIDGIILVGDVGFFMRSDDFGDSWEFSDLPLGIFSSIAALNSTLYVATQNEIYRSDDIGLTWTLHSTIQNGPIEDIFAAGDRLFISVKPGDASVLYTSTDGITWTYAHDGLPELSFEFDPLAGQHARFFKQGSAYFLSNNGTFVTLDSGQTWIPVSLTGPHPIAQGDTVFYTGGFGGGVLKSTHAAYGALMSGTVFSDQNGNGIQEANETSLTGITVGLDAPNSLNPYYFTTTNTQGSYILGVLPSSSDTMKPFVHSNYIEGIHPPYYLTEFPGDQKNFGVEFTANAHDLSVHGSLGLARPGFDVTHTVTYRNEGTTTQDVTVSVKIDTGLELLSTNPAPSENYGDSLVWYITQLPMLESGRLKLYLHVPESTPIGTELHQLSWITSDETDLTPANNSHIASRTVVGSFDPNFKEVSPDKGLTELEIAEGVELLYTIHFQNTGNYPAEIVRITDKIDTALFLPSIRLVASSHDITSFELKPGGLLEITFDNIQLPDSISDEAESHGFVTFAVQRKETYSKTQPVLNKANIHFDFNDPVITNQVAFTIRQSDPVSTSETSRREQLKIYPNPSPGSFVMLYPESMTYPVTMAIFDLHGRLVHQRTIDPGQSAYQEMFEMASGTYLVQVSDQKQIFWGRVVIHKGG